MTQSEVCKFSKKNYQTLLPTHIASDEDETSMIKLPSWRYTAIKQSILEMYNIASVNVIPINVFDIVKAFGYNIRTYRSYERKFYDVLMSASEDAVTLISYCCKTPTPIIAYNDRMSHPRINFSIMHEIGHIRLGHRESSSLAEMEANYFAQEALRPSELLEILNITNAQTIQNLFHISKTAAEYRLKNLQNKKTLCLSEFDKYYRDNVKNRFILSKPIQRDLFGESYVD